MTPSRIAIGTGALVAVVAVLLAAALVHRPAPSAGANSSPSPRPAADQPVTDSSLNDTEELVRRLQDSLRAQPDDVRELDLLGLAYQQRARETGDPAYYSKSGAVLHRALALAPHDLLATSGLGSLALSRHRFAQGLVLGRRARKISPGTARNYGVIGDALAELGRYREAFRAFQTMVDLRPGLAAYARVAHARELLGDVPGAVAAFRLALAAAEGQGEAEAWTRVQLGKLLFSHGRTSEAAAEYRAALAAFPGYAYGLDALALAEWARGRLRSAIAIEQEAVNRIPLPQYVAQLGDLYRAAGEARKAREQYRIVDAIRRLLVANGVKTDLETALFDVDHGIAMRDSLALARLAQRERPSIDGDDVLAWALARSGDCGEALHYSQRALRLGTLDALKFFHRGMIERCLGHDREARTWFGRALALNTHFSVVWGPVAARLASGRA
jgi:tetratricopeptide (TPR) repeat protein